MEFQRIFKDRYTSFLKENISAGASLDLYGKKSFEIPESEVKHLAGIKEPDDLAQKLVGLENDDFSAAKVIYEAFENIPLLIASNESFWAYLTHTSLFHYAQKRWPNVLDKSATPIYIIDHWFVGGKGLLRNTGASLWWTVHNTVDDTRSDKYELTSIMFKNYSLRTNTFGSSLIIRHREAMIGILQFLLDNPDITNDFFEPRGNYIAKYFNRLGAVKQLASLDREYFYNKCKSMKDKILSVTTRDQVINNEELFND